MHDCPKCGAVRSVSYNLFMDAYLCRTCRIAFEQVDEDVVEDYIFSDDRYVLVSTYIVEWEDVPANEADTERLDYLRKEHHHRTKNTSHGTSDKNVKRVTHNTQHSEEHERSE